MGRWGRQSPLPSETQLPPIPPPLPPRTLFRQSSFTKIGNMLNTAININAPKKQQNSTIWPTLPS
ncbi:protein phosphatase PP2A 55 kDa regulatory subunit-like [Scaptodrosophila lebanonensis]|uniref:Protein phosphatase PP2A 55 kDa regulatory subunit-like n=1 Tax=Drosophila lebanonensis TaxID=7225 RepID=A0A6J2U0A2_DROLE|nr:protein phosphatase PP2A 55 kDa regulatory subunit-like [Scaptodrosophila lebanonensis]